MKKKPNHVWAYRPQAPKYTANDKERILSQVNAFIKEKPKLSLKVSRVDMRANRIYLYELVEQFIPEGAVIIKPLIDGKYIEFPYARILDRCLRIFCASLNNSSGIIASCKPSVSKFLSALLIEYRTLPI